MQIPVPTQAFSYHDGINQVYVDPWPLHRAIFRATGGDPMALRNTIWAMKPDTTDVQALMEGYDACDALEALVRDIFKMKPFNPVTGEGAQWPQCLKVWDEFAEFLIELKKKTETLPTPSEPLAAPDSSPLTNSGSA